MPSLEFSLWMAFHQEGGFGEQRNDWRHAIGSAAVCNALGAKVRPDQLIPQFGRKAPTPLVKLRAWLDGLTPDRFFR